MDYTREGEILMELQFSNKIIDNLLPSQRHGKSSEHLIWSSSIIGTVQSNVAKGKKTYSEMCLIK